MSVILHLIYQWKRSFDHLEMINTQQFVYGLRFWIISCVDFVTEVHLEIINKIVLSSYLII